MISIPYVIKEAHVAGLPMTFDWNEEISSSFAFDIEQNIRMSRAFDEANYRTNMTLAVCIFEWFVRRFEGVFDISDAFSRLEAAYACTINPHYLNRAEFNKIELGNGEPPPDEDVLMVGIYRVWEPLKVFCAAQIGLAGECVNIALLTHHVMSGSNAFDSWFEAALRKGATAFPREVRSYDWKANFYNCTVERIIPREFFFDPDFEYSDEAAMDVLQQFLDSLDPEANPYLYTTDEMRANGYARTPYKLIDLRKG
jgi:hypothetical protein